MHSYVFHAVAVLMQISLTSVSATFNVDTITSLECPYLHLNVF